MSTETKGELTEFSGKADEAITLAGNALAQVRQIRGGRRLESVDAAEKAVANLAKLLADLRQLAQKIVQAQEKG